MGTTGRQAVRDSAKATGQGAFADLNNVEIARLVEWWLAAKGLDKDDTPHQGPKKPAMEMTIPLAE